MTDQEWKKKLSDEIAGKTPKEVLNIKESIFRQFAAGHPDEYAWKDGDRKKPTGVEYIASKIEKDMRRTFEDLYDADLGSEAARLAASMYY